ncbi:forkhead box protein R1 [Leuresthes tenuis]|uniref:forkhead box protein R1 n=1 Tax=Leuresthes tenuis TaxID=355514 RepID=UPI003B50BAE4
MTLQLKTKARLFDLHCSVALTDWDMDKELKLATTTDQFFHDEKLNDQYVVQRPCTRASRRKDEFVCCVIFNSFQSGFRVLKQPLLRLHLDYDTFVKPNLWLLVNPNIACPIKYRVHTADRQPVCEPAEESQTPLLEPAETRRPPTAELHMFPSQVELPHSVSSSTACTIKNEDAPSRPTKSRRQGRIMKTMDTVKPGCWPRPPVNYCILIALALKSSHSGSLKVQQIYNFTREHFPFFQTAPDGWKNTIRHNLCFNNSFRKTCNQLCRDGKRKSCFWHLTLDGHRRLKDELHMLTGDTLKQLERSMSQPDIIWSLLEM